MAAAAAAAAFHWSQFPDFSPYYLSGHNNMASRYPNHPAHASHLPGYHPHNHHYANAHQYHQSPHPSPQPQALFGGSAAHPASVSASPAFPAPIKPDPSLDERNRNYDRDESFSGASPTSAMTSAATPSSTTAPTNSFPSHHPQQHLHHHQQQQQQLAHSVNNNNINNNNNNNPHSAHNPLLSCSDNTNILSNVLPQPQSLGVAHPGGSPINSGISPTLAANDSAAAMAAMAASPAGYYDMYGAAGGGSFGAKGSSFYPWMKNYGGKKASKNLFSNPLCFRPRMGRRKTCLPPFLWPRAPSHPLNKF
jgi:hypothetical protein